MYYFGHSGLKKYIQSDWKGWNQCLFVIFSTSTLIFFIRKTNTLTSASEKNHRSYIYNGVQNIAWWVLASENVLVRRQTSCQPKQPKTHQFLEQKRVHSTVDINPRRKKKNDWNEWMKAFFYKNTTSSTFINCMEE